MASLIKTSRFLILFAVFIFCGEALTVATTFVIKEGGVEVGRWEEPDGQDKTEVIEQDAPKPAPQKVKAPQPISGDAGYQFTKPEIPKTNLATFAIGGRVTDIMSLQPVNGGEITFDGGGGVSVKAPFGQNGIFHATLPKIDGGNYTVMAEAKGYHPSKVFLYLNDSPLRQMSLADRVLSCEKFPQWTPLDKAYFSVEIGLCRDQKTDEEKKIYQEYMNTVNRGGSQDY